MIGSLLKSLLGGGDNMVQPEQGGSPESPAIGVPKPSLISEENQNPAGKQSVLDNVMFAILGPPDAILTPKAKAEKTAARKGAVKASNQAFESQGEEFMGPPASTGSSFGESLGKIMSIFR